VYTKTPLETLGEPRPLVGFKHSPDATGIVGTYKLNTANPVQSSVDVS